MLKYLKKLKVDVAIWQLIVALQKHKQLLIEELNKIEPSLDTTPEQMIASIITRKAL